MSNRLCFQFYIWNRAKSRKNSLVIARRLSDCRSILFLRFNENSKQIETSWWTFTTVQSSDMSRVKRLTVKRVFWSFETMAKLWKDVSEQSLDKRREISFEITYRANIKLQSSQATSVRLSSDGQTTHDCFPTFYQQNNIWTNSSKVDSTVA